MNLKKSLSLITLTCFLYSSVFGELLHASLLPAVQKQSQKLSKDDFFVPQELGKVTEAVKCSRKTLVINIQDLHCNAEVQKNIAEILKTLNDKFCLNKVYVEGGYGAVSTQWINTVKDENVKKQVAGVRGAGLRH